MMNTLYLDLVGGMSGDMFLGTLLDLGVSLESLKAGLEQLHLPGYHLHAQSVNVGGIAGTRLEVHCHDHPPTSEDLAHPSHVHEHTHEHEHEHEHHHHDHEHAHTHEHEHTHEHRGFTEIKTLIENSSLSAWVKQHALALFLKIGTAEAKIHGKTLETIHFHEVGAIDSIVDIVGACIGLELLGKPRVLASLPTDGTGYTLCAHGRIPLPVPATLAILGARAVPISQCEETSEMITPTGAAILAEFVESFGPMQHLVAEKVGISFGSRTLQTRPNMLRSIWGQTQSTSRTSATPLPYEEDTVELVQTNLDDTTAEVLGYVMERAFALGALDVWHTPIQMKKGRPAVEFSLLCHPAQLEDLVHLIFTETGSIGIRHTPFERFKLSRQTVEVQTEFGPLPVKVTRSATQTFHAKPEYEACRRLAIEKGIPLQQVIEATRLIQPPTTN